MQFVDNDDCCVLCVAAAAMEANDSTLLFGSNISLWHRQYNTRWHVLVCVCEHQTRASIMKSNEIGNWVFVRMFCGFVYTERALLSQRIDHIHSGPTSKLPQQTCVMWGDGGWGCMNIAVSFNRHNDLFISDDFRLSFLNQFHNDSVSIARNMWTNGRAQWSTLHRNSCGRKVSLFSCVCVFPFLIR